MPKPKPKTTPPTPPPTSAPWENVVGEPEPAAVAVAQPEPDGSVEAPPKAPCPGTHPEYGDLTPVYVAWYKDNHTADEYAEKYAGRMEIAESQRGGVA